MYFGGSIFLIAVGAIIRYALDVEIGSIELDLVGLILMLAGVALLLISVGQMLLANNRPGGAPPEPRPPREPREPPR